MYPDFQRFNLWSTFLSNAGLSNRCLFKNLSINGSFRLRETSFGERGFDEADHNLFSLMTDFDHILHEIEEHYGPKLTVGVYHSLSALTSLLPSSQFVVKSFDRRGSGFEGLVLFDPPFHRPGENHADFDESAAKTARMTRKRTKYFNSHEEYLELLDFCPAYSKLVLGA